MERTNCGVKAMPTAQKTFSSPGPITATTKIAINSEGIDSNASSKCPKILDFKPRIMPESEPMMKPINSAVPTIISAMPKVKCAPCSKRLKMSRPRSSVPKKCATVPEGSQEGGNSKARGSCASGEKGLPRKSSNISTMKIFLG